MINVTNGTTTGGSNILNFNPRDSIEIVSWTDDAGTHARIFGYHEKDVALVGVPAGASRASFSSAAVVELLLKQAGMLSITRIKPIIEFIEEIHASHPDCAVILNGKQEVELRKAIAPLGGALYPLGKFSGLAVEVSHSVPAAGVQVADAPILGQWAGTPLIAEHVAKKPGEAAERSRVERSEFEKIVGVLMFIASREDTGEAVRMAACHGLQQIGATLAAR